MTNSNISKILTLSIAILLVVFLSGCDDIPFLYASDDEEDVYKPDVLIIEDYFVSTQNPYIESLTSIGFTIKNNADYSETIKNVEVNFFDIHGFELIDESLQCDYGEPKTRNTKCSYGEIGPQETRTIILTLRAPDEDVVHEPLDMIISYYVSYEVTNYVQAKIPIIDDTIDEPSSKYSQTAQTDGPIKLEFTPPVGRTTITEEGKTIKEHWAYSGRPFEITLKFEDAGTKSDRAVNPTVLEIGSVKLESPSLTEAKGFRCDFNDDLKSNKEILIPGELICNLQGTAFGEELAPLYVEFTYTYQFTKTEEFEILPKI